MFRWVKYLTAFLLPVLAMVSFTSVGWMTWLPLIFSFGFVPAAEIMLGHAIRNLTSAEKELVAKDPFYDVLLYLMPLVQWGSLIFFLFSIRRGDATGWDIAGRTVSMGILCGVIGVNVAHELGHRTTAYERLMAKILLASTTFLHFYIEHNRGHHKHVGTDEDPASAQKGESVYAFFLRTIPGGFMGAWEIVSRERRRKKLKVWSAGNELIQYVVVELMIMFTVLLVFGWIALGLFLIASLMGILLLEVINYIEHYGLRRRIQEGRLYEAFRPHHAWNTDHIFSRLMLFELSRHSDHHQFPEKHYPLLDNEDAWPQMPAGYAGMFILALIPPLWFAVMDPRVDRYMAA